MRVHGTRLLWPEDISALSVVRCSMVEESATAVIHGHSSCSEVVSMSRATLNNELLHRYDESRTYGLDVRVLPCPGRLQSQQEFSILQFPRLLLLPYPGFFRLFLFSFHCCDRNVELKGSSVQTRLLRKWRKTNSAHEPANL